jgi:hypothetical protein
MLCANTWGSRSDELEVTERGWMWCFWKQDTGLETFVCHRKDYQGLAALRYPPLVEILLKSSFPFAGWFPHLLFTPYYSLLCLKSLVFFLPFVVLSTVEGHVVISFFPFSSRLFSYSSEISWALNAGVLGTSPGPHWREPIFLSPRNSSSSRKTDVWSSICSTAWRALGEHREASEGWLWLGKAPRGGVTPARCAGLYLCPWEEALLFGRGDPYLKAPFSAQYSCEWGREL